MLRRREAFLGVSRDVKNIGEEKNADPITYLPEAVLSALIHTRHNISTLKNVPELNPRYLHL